MADPAYTYEDAAPEDVAVVEGKIPSLSALVNPSLFSQLKPICGELTDLSGLSPTEILLRHSSDLLLIEQGVSGYDQILLTLAVERPHSSVIVISDHLPGHMVRALMKLEASDILPSGAGLPDVVEVAERLNEQRADVPEPTEPEANALCWAFRGAVGGCGVTTLAIEAAFDLARREGPDKVALIDLNMADGMATSFLDGQAKLDLPALSSAPERLDERLLKAWCWEHPDGVSVISAPRDPNADLLASEPAVLRLLDVACGLFEYVIVDMPRHRMGWTESVLSAADEVVVVSELTVPSLHAAADSCREIDPFRGARSPSHLVLNRMFKKRKLRAEFALDKAEKAIQRDISATITSDWDAARTAVNLGQPIAAVKAESPIVEDMTAFVLQLAPQLAEAQPKARKKKRGLF